MDAIVQIKAGIDASGYRTAVRDYTEPTVLEELAANSYDADSTTWSFYLIPARASSTLSMTESASPRKL